MASSTSPAVALCWQLTVELRSLQKDNPTSRLTTMHHLCLCPRSNLQSGQTCGDSSPDLHVPACHGSTARSLPRQSSWLVGCGTRHPERNATPNAIVAARELPGVSNPVCCAFERQRRLQAESTFTANGLLRYICILRPSGPLHSSAVSKALLVSPQPSSDYLTACARFCAQLIGQHFGTYMLPRLRRKCVNHLSGKIPSRASAPHSFFSQQNTHAAFFRWSTFRPIAEDPLHRLRKH